MECKSPPKILQLMQYVPRYLLYLSTKTPGPPRRARGLPSFVCMIKIMPASMSLFVMPLGTELDKSTRGLAALHYEMLPTVGQVVCKFPNRLLLEAAARRATVRWAAVR